METHCDVREAPEHKRKLNISWDALQSAYLVTQTSHFLGSVWRDILPRHQLQRFGELGKVLGEPPWVFLSGRRTLQEGILQNAKMKPGCSLLNSPSEPQWVWRADRGGVNADHNPGSALALDQSLTPLCLLSFLLPALLLSILGQASPLLWPATVLDCYWNNQRHICAPRSPPSSSKQSTVGHIAGMPWPWFKPYRWPTFTSAPKLCPAADQPLRQGALATGSVSWISDPVGLMLKLGLPPGGIYTVMANPADCCFYQCTVSFPAHSSSETDTSALIS